MLTDSGFYAAAVAPKIYRDSLPLPANLETRYFLAMHSKKISNLSYRHTHTLIQRMCPLRSSCTPVAVRSSCSSSVSLPSSSSSAGSCAGPWHCLWFLTQPPTRRRRPRGWTKDARLVISSRRTRKDAPRTRTLRSMTSDTNSFQGILRSALCTDSPC